MSWGLELIMRPVVLLAFSFFVLAGNGMAGETVEKPAIVKLIRALSEARGQEAADVEHRLETEIKHLQSVGQGPDVAPDLIKLIDDDNTVVVYYAAVAMSILGLNSPDIVSALDRALSKAKTSHCIAPNVCLAIPVTEADPICVALLNIDPKHERPVCTKRILNFFK